MKTLYLSGKMSGLVEHNIPRFNEIAADLRKSGYKVYNPAENPGGLSWEEYMALDIPLVCQSDAVVVFDDNWKTSPGGRYEVTIAREILKRPILRYPDLTPEPVWESPAQEAQRIVFGDRQGDYGHPLDDFGCTAALWTALSTRLFGLTIEYKPEHVALFQICIKLSRESGHHKRDNLVDIAGYANTLWMAIDERARRDKLKEALGSQWLKDFMGVSNEIKTQGRSDPQGEG